MSFRCVLLDQILTDRQYTMLFQLFIYNPFKFWTSTGVHTGVTMLILFWPITLIGSPTHRVGFHCHILLLTNHIMQMFKINFHCVSGWRIRFIFAVYTCDALVFINLNAIRKQIIKLQIKDKWYTFWYLQTWSL